MNRLEKEISNITYDILVSRNQNSIFLGTLLSLTEIHWDSTIQTAATDGEVIKFNPEFFKELCYESKQAILLHEAWHIAFEHMARLCGRDMKYYNIAADHVINLLLLDSGYSFGKFKPYADPKYTGWTTDQIYDDIIVDKDKNPSKYEKDLDNFGSDLITCEKGSEVANNISEKVQQAVTNTKLGDSESAGNIPGEIIKNIDTFLNPKVDWKTVLRRFLNDIGEDSRTYSRLSRRSTDFILPGRVKKEGLDKLIYYVDISGSISDDEIAQFHSEVKKIKEEYNPKELLLVTFDTQIQDEYLYTDNDEFDSITVVGRGGTDLKEVWKHANNHTPTAIIVFTDLYVNIPKKPPNSPLIWVVVNNNKQAPYGEQINIKV